MKLGLRALAFALLVCLRAGAQEAPDASSEPREWLSQRSRDGAGALATQGPVSSTSRLLAVGFVVAALGGVAWWSRRKSRRSTPSSPHVPIQVLGTTRLGPKAHAVVARVGPKLVLLGVTDSSVRRLAWLDPRRFATPETAVVPTTSTHEAPAARARPPGFGEILRDVFGRGAPATVEPALIAAEETRDIYVPGERRRGADAPAVVDVESQALGLVARLKELER